MKNETTNCVLFFMNWRQLDLHLWRHDLHLEVQKTPDCNHVANLRKGSIISNFIDSFLSTIKFNLNTQHNIIKIH